MTKVLRFAEQAFTVLSLLHYAGGPLVVILSGGQSQGDKITQTFDPIPVRLLFILIYVITFILLVVRWKKVLYLISKDKFIWSLVALAVLSILWSANSTITQTRIIGLIGTSLFGVYLATRYTLEQQLKILGWTFGISLVLSLVFIVLLPQYGVMTGVHAGAWRGIYPHKNTTGIVMVLTSIVFLLLAISNKEKRLLFYIGLGLSVTILLLARSTSSLFNFVNLISTLFLFYALRLRVDKMVPLISMLLTLGTTILVIIQTNADVFLAYFNKSSDLTGRSQLWVAVLDMIWTRPWLGYGYGAFWAGEGSEAETIWNIVGWKAPFAHNGWLDIWLTLGLVGLILCAIGYAFSVLRSIYWVRYGKTPECFWPGIYMIYMFLSNLSESFLMVQNNILWVLYVAAALSVLMHPERQKEQFI
jgi:O-antigen ligase